MGQEFAFDVGPSVSYALTPALRWRDGVLEQAWQGSDGAVRWEAVPTVETEPK
jgi:hypothetical protein